MTAASMKDRLASAEIIDIWPEPTPLPSGLSPVHPFNLALLPAPFRSWAGDIADRMQAPADFIAVTAMVAAGAIIGRKVCIRPQSHTDWTEVPNLWGCIIGRPGVMKSPSMKQAMAPINALERQAREDHAMLMEEFEAQKDVRELRAQARKEQMKVRFKKDLNDRCEDLIVPEEQEPKATRYIVNDGGYQALSEVIRQNAPNGVLAYRDELMSLVRSLDDESRIEDRGFYLTGWNGADSYTSDRIGRGFNLFIPAVTLSLLGSTQPGKISDYVGRCAAGAGDDGMIQRFGMMVWPDLDPNWREVDREPCPVARADAHAVFDRLSRLNPDEIGAERDPYHPERAFLRFSPDARADFKEWHRSLESRLRGDELHPAMESHLSKYRKLIPSLALIHHLVSDRMGPVQQDSLAAALAWGEYLESHAARVYGAALDPALNGAKTVLRRIKAGDLEPTFTKRTLHQKGWSGLTDLKLVEAALERLEAHNIIRVVKVQTGGAPSTECIVNPKVRRK